MRISPAGLARLQALEGWRAVVYRDEGGRETVGYGHLLTESDLESKRFAAPLTREAGGRLLLDDLGPFERGVSRVVTVSLAQHQFDALVCFAFNLGVQALRQSHLLKAINAAAVPAVIEAEWMRWVRVSKAGVKVVSEGLVKRRADEVRMWRGP